MDHSQLTADAFAKKTFDFLVAGGGTAGLVVAARLSERLGLTVGVLEAGLSAAGDGAVESPGLAGRALGSALDWQFATVPQPGLRGREMPWARGRVLGGSSALNYMTWNRAARQDYDDWRELGNDGWGWDDLLPFFKKSETCHAPSEVAKRLGASSHEGAVGRDGPVQAAYPNVFSPSHEFWHSTLNAVGVESNRTHLAGNNTGVWTSLVSYNPGSATRSYAATAYYQPNASRPNLFVLTGAEAREILLQKGNDGAWEAKGVRFVHNGVEYSAFASREVIVAAGSVQSPQLLELSGVGSSAVLSAAGIPVKVDNPNVGENLQDHLNTTIVFEVDPSLPTPDDLSIEAAFKAASEQYARDKTGPFAIVPCSMAYVPITHFTPQETVDAIISSFPTGPESADDPYAERNALLRRKFSPGRVEELGHIEYVFDLGNWGPDFVPEAGKKYASMLAMIQYPFSNGSIHIRKSDSLTSGVAIDPEYYAGRYGHLDLELALHCHRFSEKICQTQPLASIIRAQVSPTPEESKDDDGVREWMRRIMVTDWHPVGTCAMGGKQGAKAGVVDERLRVYGVRGLRVADASIMPLQISAHLQATVYAIGEKAAHMILEDLDRTA